MAQKNRKPIIGLITDFGSKGAHYVAEMKGIAKSINSNVELIDITHSISSYSIIEAAFVLFTVYNKFPSGTIFVCVVDPGVGTSRDIVCIQSTDNYTIIGPDNGIFTYFQKYDLIEFIVRVEDSDYFYEPYAQAIEIQKKMREHGSKLEKELSLSQKIPVATSLNSPNAFRKNGTINPEIMTQFPDPQNSVILASTFHGRDIMMPVAAHISNGLDIFALGTLKDTVKNISRLNAKGSEDGSKYNAIVQYVDQFGNLVTTIPISAPEIGFLTPSNHIELKVKDKTYELMFSKVFGGHKSERLLFIPGSSGFMEIVQNQASASKTLEVKIGTPLLIKFL